MTGFIRTLHSTFQVSWKALGKIFWDRGAGG